MATCQQCRAENPDTASFCRSCGTELEAVDALLGADVLGRYRITSLIGEGGMGRVYMAEQRVGTTTRKVAIKTLRPQLSADKQLARRFFREAETIVRLTHPNTIQFFDFGEIGDGTLVIVMEYIEGRSLSVELTRGPLSPDRADHIFAQICGALGEAHGLGIVHRDLKPDNILLTERGGHTDFVKVLDFGIAKISASASEEDKGTKLTQQGMMVGTPPYMSPEQFSGEGIDARSDIYSLGVIAYEMLTGNLPFNAKTPWEWASKHLTAEPEPMRIDATTGISERRVMAIRRALLKSPDQRQADVGELVREFIGDAGLRVAGLVSGVQVAAPKHPTPMLATPVHAKDTPIDPTTVATPRARPARAWWAIGAGVAVIALAGLGWALRSSSGQATTSAPPALPASVAAPTTSAPMAQPVQPSASPVAPAAAAALPLGAEPASQASDRRSHRGSRDRHTRAAVPDQAPAAPPPAPQAPPAPPTKVVAPVTTSAVVPTPAPVVPTPVARPAPAAAASVPPDLQERLDRATKAAEDRVEMAVGMYQAAASKYGEAHPALVPLKRTIARNGDARLRDLSKGKRCAQAQALYRALKAIGVAPAQERYFGPGCAAP